MVFSRLVWVVAHAWLPGRTLPLNLYQNIGENATVPRQGSCVMRGLFHGENDERISPLWSLKGWSLPDSARLKYYGKRCGFFVAFFQNDV
jgi:hypothetical protein